MTFSVHIQCSRPTPYTLTLIAPYFQVRTPQVMLDLDMPSQFTEMPAFRTRDSTFQLFPFHIPFHFPSSFPAHGSSHHVLRLAWTVWTGQRRRHPRPSTAPSLPRERRRLQQVGSAQYTTCCRPYFRPQPSPPPTILQAASTTSPRTQKDCRGHPRRRRRRRHRQTLQLFQPVFLVEGRV